MQDLIALFIVAAAAAFLIRRVWRPLGRRSAAACGACATCPSSAVGKKQELVTISPLMSPGKTSRPDGPDEARGS